VANPEHLARLVEGVEAWNHWRDRNRYIEPDLRDADLQRANLSQADLNRAKLSKANLRGADLQKALLRFADLREADLRNANLREANLLQSNLTNANLFRAQLVGADMLNANFHGAHLNKADLSNANLSLAMLTKADLGEADFSKANLSRAYLNQALLSRSNLSGASLRGADLRQAVLVRTNFEGPDLTDCLVYGISAWNLRLEGAAQSNLIITPGNESVIQVDNLEVAQFVYLLLNNEKIRHVIDTITSKIVLILGRFRPERKAVLDDIREKLREKGYLPVLFDFEKPASKDLTGTVSTLANLARFIIADLTDSSSVPHELATVVPGTVVPVQAILLEGQREYAMFVDLRRRYHWVLDPYQYTSHELLTVHLNESVIAPAEAKAKELMRK
jgi:uncharacterized protein YjbI with pentapeptide repeats